MIIVTGAAGFIASVTANQLLDAGKLLLLVDDFSRMEKERNFSRFSPKQLIDRTEFPNWLENNAQSVEAVIHLGARTDTAEQSVELFNRLNLDYSKTLWKLCTKHQIRFIYASSAATYGDGTLGFDDDHSNLNALKPLNPYGDSKHQFDLWALAQAKQPPFWFGLKFFNVYGPNEYHKSRMASVIFHTFNQVNATGGMKLFRSHNPEFKDGEQLRDFVYVKDVYSVINFLLNHQKSSDSGIYNLGTGQARHFLDLAKATFKAMKKPEHISYIDMPVDIRANYQYYTQANMTKLSEIGYDVPFTSLEDGVRDYVSNYLTLNKTL
ncbi:MAG: ADP-glyceromanno-heptose 6-epimerase [Flavobacteriales bacterium]